MRIQFERTGGFAGMTVKGDIDTASLPPEEAQSLRELVEAADVYNLPAKPSSSTPGADRFQYTLTIEDEGRRHTAELGEGAASDALRALLRRLTVLARRS
jgi:hypothetical protein